MDLSIRYVVYTSPQRLTLQCKTCEAVVGEIPAGFGIVFIRALGTPTPMILLAEGADRCMCKQCGLVPTPLIVDPEMIATVSAGINDFIQLKNPTLTVFRKEFCVTPAYSALIKERFVVKLE